MINCLTVNKLTIVNRCKILIFSLLLACGVSAQEINSKSNYIGILPSVLIEPYDNIDAVEINILPLVYEYKIGQGIGIQFRPIVNYRFFKIKSGISQTGATVLLNKYFYSLFGHNFWLTPQMAIFYTYTYNQIDKIQTMTLGVEPGVLMKFSDVFSFSLNLQPGINYYPDAYSKAFVESKNGFKSHFGIIFHFGYRF